jgi:hypothetical protein
MVVTDDLDGSDELNEFNDDDDDDDELFDDGDDMVGLLMWSDRNMALPLSNQIVMVTIFVFRALDDGEQSSRLVM